jgi:hypothetical protein
MMPQKAAFSLYLSAACLIAYQKHFIYIYTLFMGYILHLIQRQVFLTQRLYPGNISGTQGPDSLHVSGGSNPNAYMPRLQILYGY